MQVSVSTIDTNLKFFVPLRLCVEWNQRLNRDLVERVNDVDRDLPSSPRILRELNLESFSRIELSYCHHRDGLRPGLINRRRGVRLPCAARGAIRAGATATIAVARPSESSAQGGESGNDSCDRAPAAAQARGSVSRRRVCARGLKEHPKLAGGRRVDDINTW